MAALRRPTIGAVGVSLPSAPTDRSTVVPAVALLIAGAWLAAAALQVTGHATALHHHALIEGEDGAPAPPLWLGIPIFLLAWQVMIAAMMLPASLRAVGVVGRSRFVTRPAAAVAGFLAAYSIAWTGFGFLAFLGDVGLHHLVDATPWLAARPWLIQAASLGLAGVYQLVPARRRALEACRHPRPSGGRAAAPAHLADTRVGFGMGFVHAIDCLVCSWALMLLTFAAGFANLAWMAILAAVMAYEALGRHGARFGKLVGLALLALAVVAASGVALGF